MVEIMDTAYVKHAAVNADIINAAAWIKAARPRTLTLSITPVIVGAALAWGTSQKIDTSAVLAAVFASMFIQVGTNLHNDAADSERGGDGRDRLGPPRVTAAGLLSARSVKGAASLSFGFAGLLGLYLVIVGGWPILLLGLLSILCGWAYTGGPLPIAYTPLGELFVVAFFGIGAVCGTYWLCASTLSTSAIAGGLALGLLAGAVLLVNNHRDVDADRRVGRRTLAILIGPQPTAWVYAGLLLLPYALLPIISGALPDGHIWPVFVALPPAFVLIYRFGHEKSKSEFNRILLQTVQQHFLFGVLLSLGLII